MPITGQKIVDDCSKQLQDDTKVTWSAAELLGWLNMGMKQIVIAKPDAYALNKAVQLVAGTRQSIPADGNVLIRVARNMGSDGTKPGRAITALPLALLDEQNPNWHADTASATVVHSSFDPRDPRRFYVWPPQPATPGYVDVVYGGTPPDIALGDPLPVPDVYEGCLFNFVMSMAYGKDSEYGRNDTKAAEYLKKAGDLLAGMTTAQGSHDAMNNLHHGKA